MYPLQAYRVLLLYSRYLSSFAPPAPRGTPDDVGEPAPWWLVCARRSCPNPWAKFGLEQSQGWGQGQGYYVGSGLGLGTLV